MQNKCSNNNSSFTCKASPIATEIVSHNVNVVEQSLCERLDKAFNLKLKLLAVIYLSRCEQSGAYKLS